jgi:hypothetical protein
LLPGAEHSRKGVFSHANFAEWVNDEVRRVSFTSGSLRLRNLVPERGKRFGELERRE